MCNIKTLDDYREHQRIDFCVIGTSDFIGAESVEHLILARALGEGDVERFSDTHFEVRRAGKLPECWVDRKSGNYAAVFRSFMARRYNIEVGDLRALGLNIDHVHAKKIAAARGHRFVRLAIIDAGVNQSWGSWERLFAKNYKGGPGIVKNCDLAQVAKMHGIRGPRGRLTKAYIDDLYHSLSQYGTLQEAGLSHQDEMMLILSHLLYGLPVPLHFPSVTEYQAFEREHFFDDAEQKTDLTLPRTLHKRRVKKWLAAGQSPENQFGAHLAEDIYIPDLGEQLRGRNIPFTTPSPEQRLVMERLAVRLADMGRGLTSSMELNDPDLSTLDPHVTSPAT
ncbi:hypothetical protein ACC671_22180 [Rhizobium ruizarguesonis]|uniref:hypothetical protein n=1 Tax=Rhizobium leguminosarum TaxID=384 RepID=UPI001C9019DD|nr:hypothetical protein [Rhizobium leguminosarum]MBY3043192.1 hypothetical protein [Rhizobium leguminosarum]